MDKGALEVVLYFGVVPLQRDCPLLRSSKYIITVGKVFFVVLFFFLGGGGGGGTIECSIVTHTQ